MLDALLLEEELLEPAEADEDEAAEEDGEPVDGDEEFAAPPLVTTTLPRAVGCSDEQYENVPPSLKVKL